MGDGGRRGVRGVFGVRGRLDEFSPNGAPFACDGDEGIDKDVDLFSPKWVSR
jgi:hypothetical protein